MGARVLTFGFSLLIVAAVADGQRQSVGAASPSLPLCKRTEEYQQCGCLRTCCNGGKPEGCAAQCTSGCFCKEGLVRNKNGDCIPLKDCNKTTGPPTSGCGADEEYYNCVPTCRDTCETYDLKNVACPEYCRPGCFCKKGWVKNNVGKCVPTSQCKPTTEKPPRCPKDEDYNYDCAPSCTGTCEAYNNPGTYHCPLCRPGCWCRKGLVRRKDGKCVEPAKCGTSTDKCTGFNEVLVDCAKPKWCNTCGIKGNCKLAKCERGCDCKPKYYRNESEVCIPESQCPGSAPNCGVDEVYFRECAPSCTGSCDTYGKVIHCPICRPGCWCRKGLVKNKDGKCIPFAQCPNPTGCGPDEEFQECGTLCPRTCANLPYQIRCIAGCKRGCFCKEGLVRNDANVCVKPEQCPNESCGPDEEFQECGTLCPRTCANLPYEIRCIAGCKTGCFCKEGLVRNDADVCVKPEKCPNIHCKANEEYNRCGTACPETCSNLGKPQLCTDQCVKGCFCQSGFVKDDNGVCVEPSECPTEKCGVNEEYTTCGSACPETCENKNKTIFCTLQCVPGCFCKKGFVRNSQGKCINESQCEPNQCGTDEEYKECGTACPRTCASLYTKIKCIEKCVPGCFCRDDLVRNNGKCINIRDCQTQTCGENEQFSNCGPCGKTCDNKDEEIFCTQDCRTGCFCKEGYVKNRDGKCILPDQCPPASSEGFDCDKEPETGPCKAHMPRFYYDNSDGKCKSFIYGGCRGNKNNFMKEDECNKRCGGPDCGKAPDRGTCLALFPRFYYDENSGECKKFTYGGCGGNSNNFVTVDECYQKCGRTGNSFDCNKKPETGPCRAHIPRFYYDFSYGQCKSFIYGGCEGNKNNFKTEEECNKKCAKSASSCGPLEQYYSCIPSCHNTCEAYNNNTVICPRLCRKGCFCKEGYLLRKDGQCVRPEYCPITGGQCGANEVYDDCGTACPRTCKNLNAQIKCTAICKKGCFCRKGLVRNDNGICVEPSECPNGKCGVLEEYQKCGTGCPRTCRNLNIKINCLAGCVEGCFCKQGLVRNDDGECVDPSECPNEECGENEQYSTCGSACPVTCANKDSDIVCTLQCVIGCFCKRGYVRNNDGKCIPRDKCPSDRCNGLNEALVDCAKPTWCNTCIIKGNCKLAKCKRGCDCKPNYLRNVSGICIPESQCPGFCSVNEEYSDCVNPCNTCEIRGNCNFLVCNKGCDCKDGYYRDTNGICIPAETCPKTNECGEDEVYKECGTACPRTCKNLMVKIACISVCKSGCFCRDGLVRNDDGKCVDPTQCPNERCGENEHYTTCYTSCIKTCDNKDEQIFCTQECKTGCFCNEGYVRNRDKKCVLPEQCPTDRCNGVNEVLVSCAKPKWCNTCIIKGNCKLAKCDKGCDCRPNYLRNESGICIPESKCPGFCPLNEQYSDCVIPCNTCEVRGNCKFLVCNKGCDCKEGYYRNDTNGTCIPAETCPITNPPKPVCDEDEQYYNCTPDCENTCENYNKPDVVCLAICRIGCFCKSGLVKRSDGKCVQPTDCDDETPPERCGRHEKFYSCIPNCRNTCETYNKKNILCSHLCRPGCFCKEGYVLRNDNKCVHPEQCNLTTESCGRNEEYSTCGTCEKTCENKDKDIVCTQECRTGCFCRKGYVRNENDNCVRLDQCPSEPPTCGRHEKFYSCIPNCRNTCESYNKKNILCPQLCRSGCFCKEGYVLRKDKKCVRPANCNITTEPPKCEGEDEEYYEKCAPSCGGTCGREAVINCPPCRPGCWCKRGLIRSKDGKRCITPEECSAGCDFTQQYYDCMPDCENRCNPPEFCPKNCKRGCFCREDLVLRKDNMCVRKELCNETPECGPQKEYYDCYYSCRNRCDRNNKTVCPAVCETGCFCKKGLLVDRDGRCVTPEQCESAWDLNPLSGFDEISHSSRSGRAVTSEVSSEIVIIDEEEGSEEHERIRASRETGRVSSRRRIHDLFPVYGRRNCNYNQQYYLCKPDCQNQCNLPKYCPRVCLSGCFCRQGLVIRADGECVPKELCGIPSVPPQMRCGGRKEYYECYSRCRNSCENIRKGQHLVCPALCERGCFCKKGLAVDRHGRCVKRAECEGCGINEQVVDCAKPKACNTCSLRGNCNLTKCSRGCDCIPDYYRDEDGICIPESQCPDESFDESCGLHEEYSDCGSACPLTCDNYDELVMCTLQCQLGCFCEEGYVRNEEGMCILPSECPQGGNKRTLLVGRRGAFMEESAESGESGGWWSLYEDNEFSERETEW